MSNQPAIGNELRNALVAMVKKRVPESEVEDIVQQTLADAFASPHAPPDAESFRRWIFGVAKNKVVDYHRRAGRETFDLPEDIAGNAAPHQEVDMLRWAEKHLPPGDDNKATLDWMLREGDGEKLESIAETENLPAPRVRQRVSRLRRHLKQHWAKEVALLATVGVLITGILLFLRGRGPEDKPIANEDVARAEELRKHAFEDCNAAKFKECVQGFDDAKKLDPAGDTKPAVQQAREGAKKALAAPPSDSSTLNNITPPPTADPLAPSKADPVAPVPTDFGLSGDRPSKTNASPKKADGKRMKPSPKPQGTDDWGGSIPAPAPAPAPAPITPKPSGMKGSSLSSPDFSDSIGDSKDIGANNLGKVGVKSVTPSSSFAPKVSKAPATKK